VLGSVNPEGSEKTKAIIDAIPLKRKGKKMEKQLFHKKDKFSLTSPALCVNVAILYTILYYDKRHS